MTYAKQEILINIHPIEGNREGITENLRIRTLYHMR